MGHQLYIGIILLVLSGCNAITITSNGNSPRGKMPSVDVKDIEFGGFVPINPFKLAREDRKYFPKDVEQIKLEKKVDSNAFTDEKDGKYLNNTELPVNERYRRLIPYMTFYLANDFNSPQNEDYSVKPQLQNVVIPGEAENQKQTLQYTSVPKYEGNRLTNFNIASAYPGKIIKEFYQQKNRHNKYVTTQQPNTYSNNHQSNTRYPLKQVYQNIYDYQRPIPVPVKVEFVKTTEAPKYVFVGKPKYTEKPQQYKLIPYEQTPPVIVSDIQDNQEEFVPKVNPYLKKLQPASLTNNNNYRNPQLVSFQSPVKESYVNDDKLKNTVYYYTQVDNTRYNEHNNIETTSETPFRFKKPFTISPITESGFKPMISTASPTPTPKFVYITSANYIKPSVNDNYKYVTTARPTKLHYEKQTKRPIVTYSSSEEYADLSPNYGPTGEQYDQNNLAQILKTLQDAHSLPQKITADNVDASIKSLLQIINNLKANTNYQETTTAQPYYEITTTYKPNPVTQIIKQKPIYRQKLKVKTTPPPPIIEDYPAQDLESEHPGIQDIDNHAGDSLDDDRGSTPGKPGVDYPILSTIPTTKFDCKEQRYKGFFGDPETHCQVWHYCDLNGGKASFLCPNGTIFSQVALTCDWWFNVKCDTTAQLYVLNERLYKYILPYSPKFPEDYSGPLVDKYLSIKYKEMEEEENKKKEKDEGDEEEYIESSDANEEQPERLGDKSETLVDTEKLDVIEINPSGMSGALRPYGFNKK